MSLREYIRDAYPRRIREDAFNVDSITYKYDEVRANLFNFLEQVILDSTRNLVINTSDEVWISEMELFLWIKKDTTKTLYERRIDILSWIYWGKSTVWAIKNLVYQTVWGNSSSVRLEEKWVTWWTWDELFSYKVIIKLWKVSKQFKPDIFEEILKKVHPFHCNVVVETENTIEDAIWLTESILTWLHSPLVWWDSNNPLSTDTYWVDWINILEGNFWN